MKYAIVHSFKAINNEDEYETMITSLLIAKGVGVDRFNIKMDSQLVIHQIIGEYGTLNSKMQVYLGRARDLLSKFKYYIVTLVPREENMAADALSKIATDSLDEDRVNFVEYKAIKNSHAYTTLLVLEAHNSRN